MARLAAVQPLPRGERLARCHREGRRITRRAWNLMLCSSVLGALSEIAEQEAEPSWSAARWREYAAPLRKCREQRQRLRSELKRIPFAARLAAMLDHRGEP